MEFPVNFGELSRPVRLAVVVSLFLSGTLTIITVRSQLQANELQRGENTIAILAAGSASELRDARIELYRLEDSGSGKEPLSKPEALNTYQALRPLERYLELVVVCRRQGLCLNGPIVEFSCQDITKFLDVMKEGGALSELEAAETYSSTSPLAEFAVPCASERET